MQNLQLIFAIDIIRHGDRTPIHDLLFFSEHWKDKEKGILTEKGENEAFELGRIIKNYYITQTKLLPEKFSNELIAVKSSNTQRTIKTAEQIIKGMYPDAQNIKIENYPKNQDPLLPHNFSFDHVRKSFYQQAPKETIIKIESLIKDINTKLGTNFITEDIGKIADNVKINEKHNIKQKNNLPQEYYAQIKTLGSLAKIKGLSSLETSCIAALPLADNILELLDKASKFPEPKYILYTSHDVILMGFLNLINNHHIDPDYLARVQVELFQNTLSQQMFVKLSYNNTPIMICNTEYCTLQTFIETIKTRLNLCSDL
jgi:acid phosphatase